MWWKQDAKFARRKACQERRIVAFQSRSDVMQVRPAFAAEHPLRFKNASRSRMRERVATGSLQSRHWRIRSLLPRSPGWTRDSCRRKPPELASRCRSGWQAPLPCPGVDRSHGSTRLPLNRKTRDRAVGGRRTPWLCDATSSRPTRSWWEVAGDIPDPLPPRPGCRSPHGSPPETNRTNSHRRPRPDLPNLRRSRTRRVRSSGRLDDPRNRVRSMQDLSREG